MQHNPNPHASMPAEVQIKVNHIPSRAKLQCTEGIGGGVVLQSGMGESGLVCGNVGAFKGTKLHAT